MHGWFCFYKNQNQMFVRPSKKKKKKLVLTLKAVSPSRMSIKKMPRKGIDHEEHLECLRDILRLCKETNEWIWFSAKQVSEGSKYAKKEQYLKVDLEELSELGFLEKRGENYRVLTKFLEVFKKQIKVS